MQKYKNKLNHAFEYIQFWCTILQQIP